MNQQVKPFAASISKHPLFAELKLALFEEARVWMKEDTAVNYGVFLGLSKAFQSIEEWGANENVKPIKVKKSPELNAPYSTDPDLSEDPED